VELEKWLWAEKKIRLRGGEQRCVTAFFDGTNWFCRNRGCRRAWLGDDA